MNYVGYFNSLQCKSYLVKIITDRLDNNYEEIPLAAENPVVVTYDESNTPFEPIRISRASINIVYDKYLADALTSCAQGTIVELWNTTGAIEKLEWIGYLTPNTLNAGYARRFETFTLEAADCLSSLQYVDYEYVNDGGLTNLKSIIGQCVNKMNLIDGFWWGLGKFIDGPNNPLYPEKLAISEHNFTTNDTDEKWKCQEVLSEICRYLGYTLMQIGRDVYFVNYQYFDVNEKLPMMYYQKNANYTQAYSRQFDNPRTITQDCIMGSNHDISFEGIYNHIIVKDNLYAAEEFIPALFEDNNLVNRKGKDNFYEAMKIEPLFSATTLPDYVKQSGYTAMYPNGTDFWGRQQYDAEKTEDYLGKKINLKDNMYTYMHRLYDNKYWESRYYNSAGTPLVLNSAVTADSGITRYYAGGTIVDMGVVRNAHLEGNQSSTLSIAQYVVPNQMDYTRYLCICTKYNNSNRRMYDKVAYKLKDNWKPSVMLGDDSYLVLNFTALWERYADRNYINPEWANTRCKHPSLVIGDYYNKMQRPRFKLHIGNKGWCSQWNEWVDAGDSRDWVEPDIKWDADFLDYWNTEQSCLNNVLYTDKLNVSGYKIPMSGMDVTQGVEFEIYFPRPIYYGNTSGDHPEYKYYEWNAYYWIKDFSLKCVQANQPEDGNEADLVYENIPDINCSVNDLEMTCKITTNKEGLKPSYSHMIQSGATGSSFFSGYIETAIDSEIYPAEKNIINKYWKQYSTPTRKITMELDMEHSPLEKTYNVDVENPNHGYTQLGCIINYKIDTKTITFIEKDKRN